jgi:hypothetical protein
MAKTPSKAFTQLATKCQARIDAWVEQGSDPVIQKSSQAGGVCAVMVEEWIRSGLADADVAFRALLNSGVYDYFVKLQKKGAFVQSQVVKNDQFLVHDSVAKSHLTFVDRKSLQQHQSTTYDRNKTIPGLTTSDVTPQDATIPTHLDFSFELSKAARRHMPPVPPLLAPATSMMTSAFYKLGLDDSEGGSGHAIGIKVHQQTGSKAVFSVLDPNTGEFTQLNQDHFSRFWTDYMTLTYEKTYLNGTWTLLRVT